MDSSIQINGLVELPLRISDRLSFDYAIMRAGLILRDALESPGTANCLNCDANFNFRFRMPGIPKPGATDYILTYPHSSIF